MLRLLSHARSVVLGALGLWAAGACVTVCLAQTIVLSGVLGQKALLSVAGAAPRGVAVGQELQGIKVLAVRANAADIEVDGQRQTLRLGDGPISTTAPQGDASGRHRIVMHASSNGHFRSPGQINGRAVDFIVDTGASVVSISQSLADSIGLAYQDGARTLLNTANGQVVGWQTRLNSVRLGNVEIFNVDALVSPSPMPFVLLGNSYLTRFQMMRTNDELVLEQRY